jgi:hypothetical protein
LTERDTNVRPRIGRTIGGRNTHVESDKTDGADRGGRPLIGSCLVTKS